jgi:hypothetical protein
LEEVDIIEDAGDEDADKGAAPDERPLKST